MLPAGSRRQTLSVAKDAAGPREAKRAKFSQTAGMRSRVRVGVRVRVRVRVRARARARARARVRVRARVRALTLTLTLTLTRSRVLDASLGEVVGWLLYLLLNVCWCTIFAKETW